jgi:orotate phosphoribosyltransferase
MIELARPQYGHFDLGTGYHGDVWLDLEALLLRPALLRPHLQSLADRLRERRVDAVCGPMEGGAFVAYALADLMGVAFLAAYRAPAAAAPATGVVADAPEGDTSTATAYRLARTGEGIGRWRVAIADDAVNAGTAVRACAREVRERGAVPVAVAALLSVGPADHSLPATLAVPFYSVDSVPSRVWLPADCPLCADGVPLTSPASQD